MRNATRGTGPADGRSLTALALLRAVHGDDLEVTTRGPQARELLDALQAPGGRELRRPTRRHQPQGVRPLYRGGGGAGNRRGGGGNRHGRVRHGQRRPARATEPPADAAAANAAATPSAARGPRHVLRGVTAVPGLAIGPARWSKLGAFDLDGVTAGSPDEEARRLSAALEALASSSPRPPRGCPRVKPRSSRRRRCCSRSRADRSRPGRVAAGEPAAQAFKRAADEVAATFAGIEDAHLRARAIDIRDVAGRVLSELVGAGAEPRSRPASSSPTS